MYSFTIQYCGIWLPLMTPDVVTRSINQFNCPGIGGAWCISGWKGFGFASLLAGDAEFLCVEFVRGLYKQKVPPKCIHLRLRSCLSPEALMFNFRFCWRCNSRWVEVSQPRGRFVDSNKGALRDIDVLGIGVVRRRAMSSLTVHKTVSSWASFREMPYLLIEEEQGHCKASLICNRSIGVFWLPKPRPNLACWCWLTSNSSQGVIHAARPIPQGCFCPSRAPFTSSTSVTLFFPLQILLLISPAWSSLVGVSISS